MASAVGTRAWDTPDVAPARGAPPACRRPAHRPPSARDSSAPALTAPRTPGTGRALSGPALSPRATSGDIPGNTIRTSGLASITPKTTIPATQRHHRMRYRAARLTDPHQGSTTARSHRSCSSRGLSSAYRTISSTLVKTPLTRARAPTIREAASDDSRNALLRASASTPLMSMSPPSSKPACRLGSPIPSSSARRGFSSAIRLPSSRFRISAWTAATVAADPLTGWVSVTAWSAVTRPATSAMACHAGLVRHGGADPVGSYRGAAHRPVTGRCGLGLPVHGFARGDPVRATERAAHRIAHRGRLG